MKQNWKNLFPLSFDGFLPYSYSYVQQQKTAPCPRVESMEMSPPPHSDTVRVHCTLLQEVTVLMIRS